MPPLLLPKVTSPEGYLLGLWMHECQRVFADKLVGAGWNYMQRWVPLYPAPPRAARNKRLPAGCCAQPPARRPARALPRARTPPICRPLRARGPSR
jgi:hypothetical protein